MTIKGEAAALESKNVSFGYGESFILKNISFSVQRGDFVALMGPNGSGKTTLLKTLLGLFHPLEGEVLLNGKPVGSYGPKERAKLIGYVAQETVFSFPLTVGELVALGRYPYGTRFKGSPSDKAVISEALRLTESTALTERKYTTLSGGERQKALIARVLAQTSNLLLLDEPITHLDLYFQLQILKTLKKICSEKGSAIIAVLHDLNLASLFADKALLLKSGEAVAFGSVEDVVNEDSVREIFAVEVVKKTDPGQGAHYFFTRGHVGEPSKGR